MRYIRQRENGSYQVRIYNDDTQFSFTSPDLKEVVKRRNEELGFDPDIEISEPKILFFDIETAPILAYVWDIWNQNIGLNQIKDDWYLLCFAYKWLGDTKSRVIRLCDYDDYKPGRTNEDKLVQDLYLLLDEADIVIAHNAAAFDVKKVNAKFLEYGLQRPSPYRVVDTLKIARANFELTSNKLDYISRFIKSGGKLEHGGMELWLGCMAGKVDSWKLMASYNLRDVDELERVYLALRGWDSTHPNVTGYYNDDKLRCFACGSTEVEPMLTRVYTNSNAFAAYRCKTCGQVMRERKGLNPVNGLVGSK